jgi:predicted dehydrogenase
MAIAMRIAIAGTGSIGRRHIRNIQKFVADCEFVLIREDGADDAYSRELRAQVFRSIQHAIPTGLDAVVVATPSALHLTTLASAVKAGLPVYVEKPVLTSSADALALRKLISERGYRAPTLAGCNLRFLPSLQRMRNLLKEGAVGKVVRALLEAGQWLPDWRPQQDYRNGYSARNELGGGVVLDLIHELDATRWFFGDFDNVKASLGRFSGLEIDVEDCASIVLSRQSGPVVSVNLDYVSRQPIRRYAVVGTEGSLVWDLSTRSLQLVRADGISNVDCGDDGFDMAKTYDMAMIDFIVAVRDGSPTSQDIHEGLASVELALRVKEVSSR